MLPPILQGETDRLFHILDRLPRPFQKNRESIERHFAHPLPEAPGCLSPEPAGPLHRPPALPTVVASALLPLCESSHCRAVKSKSLKPDPAARGGEGKGAEGHRLPMNLGLETEPSRFQVFQLASRFSVIPQFAFRNPPLDTARNEALSLSKGNPHLC